MTPQGTVGWGQPTAMTQQSMMTAMATAHTSRAPWLVCTMVLPKMPPSTQVTMARAPLAVMHSVEHSAYLYDMLSLGETALQVFEQGRCAASVSCSFADTHAQC